jgi:hypothetical protein
VYYVYNGKKREKKNATGYPGNVSGYPEQDIW